MATTVTRVLEEAIEAEVTIMESCRHERRRRQEHVKAAALAWERLHWQVLPQALPQEWQVI